MEFGFLLKKFVTFFVEPFGVVFTLLALGLIFLYMKKKQSKLFLSLGLVFLFLFSYPPFSNFLVQNLENQYPKYNCKHDVKYIHVLGSGHNTDETQPISSHLSGAGTKRVLEGIIIHNQIPNSRIIFTGYAGDTDTTNAKMNAQLATALGVTQKEMIINGMPSDTEEEAKFTKTLVADEPFILVTSATHMPRAMMIFKSLGLNPIAAPTSFYKSEFKGYLRAPKPRYFYISTIAMHEYIGMLWVKIR
ncbi:MAG: ElyC/SanA/YdcF family protein [Sulfurimonas sp.]